MNIVVLLRAVRHPAAFTVNRRAQKIFVNREDFILNPADHNALEAALAMSGAGHRVTAAAYGGAAAEDALRQARAMGVQRAVLVSDDGLPAADATAMTIVAQRLLEHLGGADLVLLGASVLDADLAQVGPRLATALDWPLVEAALAVQPALEGAALAATVRGSDGYERWEVDLPAVVSIAVDSNRTRFAPAAQIITIYSTPEAVERLSLADLGLDAAALTPLMTVRGEAFPPERTLAHVLDSPPEHAVQQLAQALRRATET